MNFNLDAMPATGLEAGRLKQGDDKIRSTLTFMSMTFQPGCCYWWGWEEERGGWVWMGGERGSDVSRLVLQSQGTS